MPNLMTLERFVWMLVWAGTVILAVRLYVLGLHKIYRWFFAFLVFSAARTAVMFPLSLDRSLASVPYAWVWLVSSPLLWILYALMVFELYGLVLNNHPGLRTIGQRVLYVSLSFAVAMSAVTVMAAWNAKDVRHRAVFLYLTLERGIDFSLVLLLLLILAFLAWFPVPLARNIVMHSVIFSAYFLSRSAMLLVGNVVGEDLNKLVSALLLAISAGCMFAWLRLLTREGEDRVVVTGYDHARERELRLVAQLGAINDSLVRAARK